MPLQKGACMLHDKAKQWPRGDEGLGYEIPAAGFVWWLCRGVRLQVYSLC
jgi:hypothetical protein